MEDSEKKTYVQVMTDEKDESVISAFLEVAKSTVLNILYPHEADEEKRVWLNRYDSTQCKIAAYMLNKRGAEGETMHSENGISRTYANADIPNDLKNEITPFAKVPRV